MRLEEVAAMRIDEMPEVKTGEYVPASLPMPEYSTRNFVKGRDSLRERFDHLGEFSAGGKTFSVHRGKSRTDLILVSYTAHPADEDATIAAVLELKRWSGATTFFDESSAWQVKSAFVYPKFRDSDVGAALYSHLVTECGFVLISDFQQYIPAVRLWKRLAKQKEATSVLILNGEKILMDGDAPVVFDTKNIQDRKIWSKEYDTTGHSILLVLTNKISL